MSTYEHKPRADSYPRLSVGSKLERQSPNEPENSIKHTSVLWKDFLQARRKYGRTRRPFATDQGCRRYRRKAVLRRFGNLERCDLMFVEKLIYGSMNNLVPGPV
jgi:hypothetical protein